MPALKDIDIEKIAYVPHAYFIEELTLTNRIGEAVDIQFLAQEISISESIYSSTAVLTVGIKDESNIIETLPIYGYETIMLKMKRRQGPDGKFQYIERLFYITEYPLYGRPRNEHVQIYTLSAVSYHSWKNPLIKISRYYTGPIADQIAKIADDAFGLKVLISGAPFPKGRGIINIQKPLQAIDWFRRRLHEDTGTPFYFYETIQSKPNEIFLESHTEIVKKDPHHKYYDTRLYREELVGSQEDYEERKKKIVESSSQLKFSKFVPIPTGTWGSENNYLDIAKRTFFKKFYNYKADFPISNTLYGTSVLEKPVDFEFKDVPPPPGEPKPNENKEEIAEEYFSYLEHMSLNSQAYFASEEQNYNQWSHEKVFIMNAFPDVFNNLIHTVKVYGDFELNPGKVVELYFPKSGDPAVTKAENDPWDRNLSGRYVVISAVHKFINQEYFTEIKVKRDSLVL